MTATRRSSNKSKNRPTASMMAANNGNSKTGGRIQGKPRPKKLPRTGQAALYELAQLGRKLAEADTAKAVALATIEAARELFAWDSCWLGAWHEQRKEWEELIAFDLVDGVRQEVTAQTTMKFHSSIMTQRTIEEGPQLLHRRDEQDQPEVTTLLGNGQRSLSLMFEPIRVSHRPVGILSIQSYQLDAFDRRALELLQTLADHCAGALARVRTRQQLDGSRLRFKKLFEAAPEAILLIATKKIAVGFWRPTRQRRRCTVMPRAKCWD